MNQVWSHADIMRGRAMIVALCGVVLLKEMAVPVAAFLTGMTIDPFWAESRAGVFPAGQKGWLLLGIKAMFLFLTYHRRLWARGFFGVLYLVTGGLALYAACPRDLVFAGLPRETLLSLVNAGAGLLIGVVLLTVPQLRAYEDSYAPGGVTIPIVPAESGLAGGGGLLRRLVAFIGTLWNLLPVLAVVGLFVYAMNWHALLRQGLAGLLGR